MIPVYCAACGTMHLDASECPRKARAAQLVQRAEAIRAKVRRSIARTRSEAAKAHAAAGRPPRERQRPKLRLVTGGAGVVKER